MVIFSFLVLKFLLYIIFLRVHIFINTNFFKSCVDLVLIVLKVSKKKNDSGKTYQSRRCNLASFRKTQICRLFILFDDVYNSK